MTAIRRFVLFELNEVPLRVVRHFADRNPGSSFAKVLDKGRHWTTVTPDQGHLSPWITWPTLHRGVSSAEHGIGALGQDVSATDRKFPPVWKILANEGRRVGMFGSLHSYPPPEDLDAYDFYVPDTFAAGPEAKPAELAAFQQFNLHMVDRSGRNVSGELPVKQALPFLLRSLPAGLRPVTMAKVARQVATERIWRHRTARRRTIQSLLAFDLFLAQLQSKKPDAAFFFTNHVASSMHRYWPATFTADYEATKWSDEWVNRFAGEVDYVMGEADQMLGDLLAFADRNPDYIILVASSMGQAAVDETNRQISTELLLRDMDRFLQVIGVRGGWQRRRTMEPTYTLAFEEESAAEACIAGLARVKIAGRPIECRRLDAHGIEFVLGHPNIAERDLVITIGNRQVSPDEVGLANVSIEDEVGAAAYHIPEGMLLAYDPRRAWARGPSHDPVSTTAIAPTLLALQGIEASAYMEHPIGEIADLGGTRTNRPPKADQALRVRQPA
jgi:hypothetical protein